MTHTWGGPLGVPRDWWASCGLDRTTGLAWSGGYVGDGVGTTNLGGRTLTDLILARVRPHVTALGGPSVQEVGARAVPLARHEHRAEGHDECRPRGGPHRQAVTARGHVRSQDRPLGWHPPSWAGGRWARSAREQITATKDAVGVRHAVDHLLHFRPWTRSLSPSFLIPQHRCLACSPPTLASWNGARGDPPPQPPSTHYMASADETAWRPRERMHIEAALAWPSRGCPRSRRVRPQCAYARAAATPSRPRWPRSRRGRLRRPPRPRAPFPGRQGRRRTREASVLWDPLRGRERPRPPRLGGNAAGDRLRRRVRRPHQCSR